MVKERRVSRSRVGEFNIEAQENAKGWSQVSVHVELEGGLWVARLGRHRSHQSCVDSGLVVAGTEGPSVWTLHESSSWWPAPLILCTPLILQTQVQVGIVI